MQAPHLLPIAPDLRNKTATLLDCFRGLDGVLVAFSGGVDSTLVLKIAAEVLGARATAVTAASPTLPCEELEAVRQLSEEIGARLIVASTNQLDVEAFVRNDAMRCYHCKTDLYRLLGARSTGHGHCHDRRRRPRGRPGRRPAGAASGPGVRRSQPAGGSRVSQNRRARPG